MFASKCKCNTKWDDHERYGHYLVVFSFIMAIVVQIVLEFESWTIVESTCVLHQMQGLFDFLLSWSCGSCNGNFMIFFLYYNCEEVNTWK